ncbi:MAG: hypothetical protein JW839_05520 [Candidatus Lokiarchaeota archaeon]|nr:hypothetical protein [Candidatus Lokiarchaeota archaeon]
MDTRDYMKKGIRGLQDAMHNKAYAKLGDAVANLIYCMAKAKIAAALHGRLDISGASKVSATILRDAAAVASERSGEKIGARGGAHEKADVAEAVIGYGWAFDLVTLDECAGLVAAPCIERKPEKLRDEFEAFVEGFSAVLERVLDRA